MPGSIRRFLRRVGRPLPSYRRWIREEINTRLSEAETRIESRAHAQHEISSASLEELANSQLELKDLSTSLESQLRSLKETNAAVARNLEVRVLFAQEEVRRGSREFIARQHAELRKSFEARVRLACFEAQSYADQGLFSLSQSLAAATRAIVDANKRASVVERSVGDIRHLPTQYADLKSGVDEIGQRVGHVVADYNTQLRAVEARLEFVRRETLYEMQALNYRSSTEPKQDGFSARILNAAKVEEMRETGIKLNVGCGHIQMDGYLNADQRELPGVDVQADALNLPFDDGELAEIHSSHLLEHFSEHILDRVLLPYWRSKLKPGGILTTVAPDGAAMLEGVSSGMMTFEDFREVLFGAQDYDGDYHYNLLTAESLSNSLERAGFVDVKEEYSGKRNGKCFEFRVSARKG
jgi:predicted SAM-dependent methyltransferase